jgi:hypothetical protein
MDPDVDAQIQVPRSPLLNAQSSQKRASPDSIPASSITPPPSTQATQLLDAVAPTPSPPPGIRSPPPTGRNVAATIEAVDIPTSTQIDSASVESLRAMVASLSISLQQARASVAHYKLHTELSELKNNNLEVELQMMNRDFEVLHGLEEQRRATKPAAVAEHANAALVSDLNRQVAILQQDNDELRLHLNAARKSVEERDDRLLALEEQNHSLRSRIRTNREHLNGLLETVYDKSPTSAMNTPARAGASIYATPRTSTVRAPPMSAPARHSHERRDNFDALLLADKVLSQETAPSTPRRGGGLGASRHTRAAHSISSLPATPERRIAPRLFMGLSSGGAMDRASASIGGGGVPSTARLGPLPPPPFPLGLGGGSRRRASSDSTISLHGDEAVMALASRVGLRTVVSGPSFDRAGAMDEDEDDDDEIPESEASQAAASMLRTSVTPKRQKVRAAGEPGPKQARIVGRTTKPAGEAKPSPEKRRMASGAVGPEVGRAGGAAGLSASPKKRRLEGVGLGIGV